MKKHLLAYSFGAMVFITNALQAQAPQQHPPHHKPNPEMRAALKQHFQDNMLPILKETHAKFDAAIPTADLQFLQQERAKAALLREQKRELHQKARQYESSGKTHEEVKALMQPEHQQLHQQKEALAKEMEPFIVKHKSLIDKYIAELQPLHEQWKTQRHSIREQFRPADAPAHPEGKDCPKPQGGRGKHGEHGHHHADKGQDHQNRQIVRFLLWNGEMPEEHPHQPPHFGNDDEPEQPNNREQNLPQVPSAMTLYPNPAMDNTTLKFNLEAQAQNVSLKIMDANGRLVRETNLGNLSAGSHSSQIALQDLPSGQYLCILNAGGNQQTQQFIIKR